MVAFVHDLTNYFKQALKQICNFVQWNGRMFQYKSICVNCVLAGNDPPSFTEALFSCTYIYVHTHPVSISFRLFVVWWTECKHGLGKLWIHDVCTHTHNTHTHTHTHTHMHTRTHTHTDTLQLLVHIHSTLLCNVFTCLVLHLSSPPSPLFSTHGWLWPHVWGRRVRFRRCVVS